MTTPQDTSSRSSNRSGDSARREVDSNSVSQRGPLVRTLVALCKNLYYLHFALRNGLAGAVWRGCSFGRVRAANALCWKIACPAIEQPEELLDWLRHQGLRIIDAEHALYLPPQEALLETFPEMATFYPPNCGYKILKDLRPATESNYLAGRPGSVFVRRRLTGSPAEMVVTANYMHTLGLGPRVWDLCNWEGEGNRLTVFVVEHVSGTTPTNDECSGFLKRLRQIQKKSLLNILMPRWETQDDFESPGCRGNLIAAAKDAGPQYVDFQNFRLRDPLDWTREIAERDEQARPTALGAVPPMTTEAADVIVAELCSLGLRFRHRTVHHLDCGCGELLNAALIAGADWAYGSTAADRMEKAYENLLAKGAGRFTILADEVSAVESGSSCPCGQWNRSADSILFCQLAPHDSDRMLQRVAAHEWQTLVCLTNPEAVTDELILTQLKSCIDVNRPVTIAHTIVNRQLKIGLFVVNKA